MCRGEFNIHGHEGPEKLTVDGDIDPVHIIVARLRKLCCTEIVTVGLAKEPAKKKKEPKKEEPKKYDLDVAERVRAQTTNS
ncbi:COPPER TRANSPORT PROTEIN FAMILY-RELATED [Salix koriyanagi]|uniref:COPPER TRANSPORT PROTEIN FAMILY-RELATED n=1 Tax=Salix koriyanagi TaxID=2511006 RepID=A0A9Q0TDP1_9ROSI|nr:COPPER TRANSPORT PROTEIN FAMILY-RELATED [Salix koriyanagi]